MEYKTYFSFVKAVIEAQKLAKEKASAIVYDDDCSEYSVLEIEYDEDIEDYITKFYHDNAPDCDEELFADDFTVYTFFYNGEKIEVEEKEIEAEVTVKFHLK